MIVVLVVVIQVVVVVLLVVVHVTVWTLVVHLVVKLVVVIELVVVVVIHVSVSVVVHVVAVVVVVVVNVVVLVKVVECIVVASRHRWVLVIIRSYLLYLVRWHKSVSKFHTKTGCLLVPLIGIGYRGCLSRVRRRVDLEHFPNMIHDHDTVFVTWNDPLQILVDYRVLRMVLLNLSFMNCCPSRIVLGVIGGIRTLGRLSVFRGHGFLRLCSIAWWHLSINGSCFRCGTMRLSVRMLEANFSVGRWWRRVSGCVGSHVAVGSRFFLVPSH